MARPPSHHRPHDYKYLIKRWRAIAARCGLALKKYGEAGGFDLYFLRSKVVADNAPSIYLSAGIHGDEPAATEGLLAWAEKHPALLARLNLLIFPCLNPWGLTNNSRLDDQGHDLNRSYHHQAIPQIVAQMALFTDDKFDLASMLHEDYDARGVYLYEVQRQRPFWGEALIAASARHIGPDPRRNIEGRPARNGIVRRKIDTKLMPEWPEAFILYFQKVARVFTIETPSEFHIDTRVKAHVAMLEKSVALCRAEFRQKAH